MLFQINVFEQIVFNPKQFIVITSIFQIHIVFELIVPIPRAPDTNKSLNSKQKGKEWAYIKQNTDFGKMDHVTQ
jgi:hypothetical protein